MYRNRSPVMHIEGDTAAVTRPALARASVPASGPCRRSAAPGAGASPARRTQTVRSPWWPVLLGVLASTGCGDPTGIHPESVSIQLEVAGGLADVAWTILVDGEAGLVRGVSCERGCSFQTGSVILPLSPDQVTSLARELDDAGAFGFDGRDFGIDCCDQFEYRLEYDRYLRHSAITGSSGALPEALAAAVARLHGLAERRVDALVDFSTTPADWPADPIVIDSLTLEGSELTAFLAWTGGCTPHSVDLVLWNGFLESEPVRVGGVFAHDARGDTCEAFIHETRTFDLGPLREAWRRAYRFDSGRIILNLTAAGGGEGQTLDYRF